MRFPQRSVRHSSTLMFVLLVLGMGVSAPAAPPAHAAGVAVTPATLDLSLPLGQTADTSFSLLNTEGIPLAITVLEANEATARQALRSAARAQIPAQAGRVAPDLLRATRAAPQQQRDFIIYMGDQADLSAAYSIDDWKARGEYVYRTLADHAGRTQADLLAQLRERGVSYRSFWVVNAVLAHGDAADVQAVARRADVALVRANHTAALPEEQATTADDDPCSPDKPGSAICWNVRMLGADRVWSELGVNGAGVVVANLDTGVDVTHPALKSSYRGTQADGSLLNDYNWFDPQGSEPIPADNNGHGTHTMGTMVGAQVDGKLGIGVAPGAHWIAAQGCESQTCSDSDLIAGAQWLLAPTKQDGTQPRADLRPMIVNNSWSGYPDDEWFAPYTAAWRAAGMFPVFAAGNASAQQERTCSSAGSPGDYADVLGVGAVDSAGQIASFSLLGPTADGRMKPDFAAPGAKVYSSIPVKYGSYRLLNGTSMATPAVSAVVALMWSANPALIGDYDATYALLRASAIPTSDTRCGDAAGAPNSVYGYGLVDAYAAVAQAKVDIPWLSVDLPPAALAGGAQAQLAVHVDAANVPGPGTYSARIQVYSDDRTVPLATLPISIHVQDVAGQAVLQGQVRHATTDKPILASVQAARVGSTGTSVKTDGDGRFQLTLAPGQPYDVIASASSFFTNHQTVTITQSGTLDLLLRPDQPDAVASTDAISFSLGLGEQYQAQISLKNQGARPLYYDVTVPNGDFSVSTSDEPGGPTYSWVDLPQSAQTLPAGHARIVDDIPLGISFPFYTYTITNAVLTSDGMLNFDRPITYLGVTSNCLPDSWMGFYMIAPLRMDFDTSQRGSVRYARVGDSFVVSYEGVPLYGASDGQTYTFQLILHADGRIVFQYRQLGLLPTRASAGVQRAPADFLSLGCGPTLGIHDEMAVELRPQPSAAGWLTASALSGVLQSGEQVQLPVHATWARPVSPQAVYAGQVVIHSSDPLEPTIMIPVSMAPRPAPYESMLPIAGRR